jgi:hypothetical protein
MREGKFFQNDFYFNMTKKFLFKGTPDSLGGALCAFDTPKKSLTE